MLLSLCFAVAVCWCARESLLAALVALRNWVDGLLAAILRPASPFACAFAGGSLRESAPEGARAWERIDLDPPTTAAPLPPPLSVEASAEASTCPRCGLSVRLRPDGYLYCQSCGWYGYPAGTLDLPTPAPVADPAPTLSTLEGLRCGVSVPARADGYRYCQPCVGAGYPSDLQAGTTPAPVAMALSTLEGLRFLWDCELTTAERAEFLASVAPAPAAPGAAVEAEAVPTPSAPSNVPIMAQETAGEAGMASLPLPAPAPSDLAGLFVREGAKHRSARSGDVGPFFTRRRAPKAMGKRWEYTAATVADVA